MRIPFLELPGISTVARPVAPIEIEGLEETSLTCLLDTGSLHNRFGAWVADVAGVELSGAEAESLGIGGRSTIGRTLVVRLRLGDYEWDAPVTFCDPWPWDFQILGLEGFFRRFRVCVEAAELVTEVTPIV